MKYVCVLATVPDNVALVVAAVVGVLILGWVWRVHTDLTNRRERLRGLVADIKTAHGEVTAVENIGKRHANVAGEIEHRQRRTVARPKRGAGGFIDNVQYPDAGALTAVNFGQQADMSVRILNRESQQKLNEEAAAYNAAIGRFPTLLIAGSMGFYRWDIRVPTPNRSTNTGSHLRYCGRREPQHNTKRRVASGANRFPKKPRR